MRAGLRFFLFGLTVYLFVMTSGARAFYPKAEEAYRAKVEDHVRRQVEKNPAVYFLKDEHQLDQTELFVDLVTEILRQDQQVNCLLLELPEDFFQTAIDSFMQTGSFDQLRQANHEIQDIYNVWPPASGINEKRTLFLLSKEIGLNVYAVDELPAPEIYAERAELIRIAHRSKLEIDQDRFWQYTTYHFGHLRNIIMADQIADHFQQEQCTGAIALVGASHLENKGRLSDFEDVLVLPIQKLLKDQHSVSSRQLVSH